MLITFNFSYLENSFVVFYLSFNFILAPGASAHEGFDHRRRTKRFWTPRITLSYNHHTPNSRPSCYSIHTHNHPAYG